MFNTQEANKVETEIYAFWEKNKIYEKLMERKGKNYFLLDGPPYANFIPHAGHIKNTVFKDMCIRLAFMKGFNVFFQPGFDTHGLPIENMVEKKLKLNSKKDIEKFGIAKFMKECRDNAALNKDIWMKVYKTLGSVYALKKPYLTYENYYIQSAWWSFSEMYKKKMVYWGEKPVMWCPHCETSLAGYEVTDSYADVKDTGIYVLFKLKDSDEHLLVYTTTPWTLPGNVAIAIAPEEDYVTVEANNIKMILAEKRLEKLSEIGLGYTLLKKFKGKDLVGKEYEPLLDVPLQRALTTGKLGKAHEIVASIPLLKERIASKIKAKKSVESKSKDLFEEFVVVTEGTGLVHTAPGHGKTDYMVGQHYKLACVSPVDERCHLIEESGFFGFVKDADKDILERLHKENKLLHKEEIVHSYPLCWRCKSPLIFRLSKQLFLKIDKVKKIIQKENKKVEWLPEFARERFDNWVENAEDWNVSRQRYWGVPIPLWFCDHCEKEKVISSKEELERLAGKKIDDLHAVEALKIKCECGKQMKKFKGILDVWFDAGISPWASIGYPFDNKEFFLDHFPVNRINEAQDQIRGWFYALMFCSTAVFKKTACKSISMTGWVLDKDGNKMSKSLNNVVYAEDALKELGADMLRYYFCWDVAPYETQKFNTEIAKKEIGRILNVFWNLQNLTANLEIGKLEIEDKWIISRLNSLIQNYEKNIDNFELQAATREFGDFILNDLSRNYVQMTREKENRAIITLCLQELAKLLAPICPFITEKIWQNLRAKGIVKEESVHLCQWPKHMNKIDKKLEEEMEDVSKIVAEGLAQRSKTQFGLRWPLSRASIVYDKVLDKNLLDLIKRQLNVKKIEFKKGKEFKVILDLKMNPELEAEGYFREATRLVQDARKNIGLKKGQKIKLNIECDEILENYLKNFEKIICGKVNTDKINFSKDRLKHIFDKKIKDKNIKISLDIL
jgi:isoleucyl-tRNA synthetase